MAVEFNPSINVEDIKKQYALDKRTRVENVLDQDQAAQIAVHIHDNVPFDVAYVLDGQYQTRSYDELKTMPASERDQLLHNLHGEASKGVGFFYGRHPLKRSSSKNDIVQQAFEFLNSADTLDAIKRISGFDDIVAASAQVTRYYPGNYLTRHNDVHDSEERRVAYVLNLTPEWHPDWGGLLQFYQPDGTPRDAWAPVFNSLALFDVNHVHSVTYVAPYARKPRLSITGWFRAKPL